MRFSTSGVNIASENPSPAMMQFACRRTLTLSVVNRMKNVFLEVRGRESNSLMGFLSEPANVLEPPRGRGRRKTITLSQGSAVELVRGKTHTFITDAREQNVCSPYLIVQRPPARGEEAGIVSKQFSAVTTPERMRSFVRDCYAVNAEAGENTLYMMVTLRATENLFLLLVERELLPLEVAEKAYDRFEKLKLRLYGPSGDMKSMEQHIKATSPWERRIAYDKAFLVLSKAVGM